MRKYHGFAQKDVGNASKGIQIKKKTTANVLLDEHI